MKFGWIDFSKEDKNNAINVINSMKEKGILDELGFGSIRKVFANDFFPGTSTIQTRAKYFLIIPYELQDFIQNEKTFTENRNAAAFIKNAQNQINADEKNIGERLFNTYKDDSQTIGIIGSRSIEEKTWVERGPLSIYWSGLRTYNFFRSEEENFTYTDFLSTLYNFECNKKNSKDAENKNKDEKNDSDAGKFSKKSPLVKIETYKKNWKEKIKIDLTKDEAFFLKKKIISSVPDSIMALLLEKNIDLSACMNGSEKNSFELFTKEVKNYVDEKTLKKLDLANKVNDFYYITMLRYSFQLSKGQSKEVCDEWERVKAKVKGMCEVLNIDELFKIMKIKNPKLELFLKNIKQAFLNNNIEKVDSLIKKREFDLKGNRAKLSKDDFKDPEIGIYAKFDYRLKNAWKIIDDIRWGEKK